jgi:RHS repeat-associated protein
MSAYTTKGFTGQYNDPTSGLDYYISRYYDPVASIFLSADIKAGNMQGMNPYGYVGGNPETTNDPTGQMVARPPGGGYVSQTDAQAYAYYYAVSKTIASSGLPALLDMFLHHRDGGVLAESYAQSVKHTTTEILLGQEAFALIHSKGINWNANTQMMQLFLTLRSLTIASTMVVAGTGVNGAISTMNDLLMVTRESEAALTGESHTTVDDQEPFML